MEYKSKNHDISDVKSVLETEILKNREIEKGDLEIINGTFDYTSKLGTGFRVRGVELRFKIKGKELDSFVVRIAPILGGVYFVPIPKKVSENKRNFNKKAPEVNVAYTRPESLESVINAVKMEVSIATGCSKYDKGTEDLSENKKAVTKNSKPKLAHNGQEIYDVDFSKPYDACMKERVVYEDLVRWELHRRLINYGGRAYSVSSFQLEQDINKDFLDKKKLEETIKAYKKVSPTKITNKNNIGYSIYNK